MPKKKKKEPIAEEPVVAEVIEEPVVEEAPVAEEPVAEEPVEEPVEEAAPVPTVAPPPLESPSPVDRGQLYVESHPILGVTRKATVISQSVGDGRLGDGATVVRE